MSASAQAREALAVGKLTGEQRTALENFTSDGIRFGIIGGWWCAAACGLVIAKSDRLEYVLELVGQYEAADTRGLTVSV